MINLLSNSVKYVGDGGLVLLRMDVVRRSDHDHQIAFSVEDNGPGVSSTEQAAMFMKFRTFHKNSGTGLGLHLTSVIVGRMGGDITVTSPPPGMKHGSAFSFMVSLKAESCSSDKLSGSSPAYILKSRPSSSLPFGGTDRSEEKGGVPPTMQSLRVLVVDDEPINVRILERKLTREPIAGLGWTVETASSLPECLEKSTKGPPYDVLFLDECFPGHAITGSAYISTLRARGVTAAVFMCSANCSRSDELRYRKLGAAGVFPKPVPNGATLLAVVTQSLLNNPAAVGSPTNLPTGMSAAW